MGAGTERPGVMELDVTVTEPSSRLQDMQGLMHVSSDPCHAPILEW